MATRVGMKPMKKEPVPTPAPAAEPEQPKAEAPKAVTKRGRKKTTK